MIYSLKDIFKPLHKLYKQESKTFGKGWCYKFTNYGRRRTFPLEFLHSYRRDIRKGNKSSIELEISHVSNSENGLLTRGITIIPNDD